MLLHYQFDLYMLTAKLEKATSCNLQHNFWHKLINTLWHTFSDRLLRAFYVNTTDTGENSKRKVRLFDVQCMGRSTDYCIPMH